MNSSWINKVVKRNRFNYYMIYLMYVFRRKIIII